MIPMSSGKLHIPFTIIKVVSIQYKSSTGGSWILIGDVKMKQDVVAVNVLLSFILSHVDVFAIIFMSISSCPRLKY